jgi:thioredoxin reductase (NADPH)
VAMYECVQMRHATVRGIEQSGDLFVLHDETGGTHQSRGLILAMGVEYLLPDIPGILAYAGRSIWHCPECDGYKCRGKKIAVMGTGVGSAEMALGLSIWSDEIILCVNGAESELTREALEKLRAAGIAVVPQKIRGLAGNLEEGQLEAIEFEDATRRTVYGAFANEGCGTPDELLAQLPLELHKGRWVKVDHRMRTNIPRCYAAGDLIAFAQTQLSVAMGTGATAAIGLHKELLPEALRLSAPT